ncbi:hydroxyisourate hydrolase [Streptomyces sp. NBRC 109706]|uniref:hydroxyisourate hydrolase n=1 Tax=Streptomyces sp. NBRC 109706 TaxID=1550035 RepID=UPI00131B1349|nr:hydroxyisourate hydrolase [Streptomyces sp. NBRC 109706]
MTVEALESLHGRSAAGLRVRLAALVDQEWVLLAERKTDERGRIDNWDGPAESQGLYQIVFDVDRYFSGLGVIPTCPEVVTTFRISREQAECRVSLNFSLHHYFVAFS